MLYQITGDNLGLNNLLGFTESFIADYCCRLCFMNKKERKVRHLENTSKLKNYDHYNKCLFEAKGGKPSMGIKSDSCMNSLDYFCVNDNYVLDCMHDLLEGVTSKVLSLVLNRLIFTDKFFL